MVRSFLGTLILVMGGFTAILFAGEMATRDNVEIQKVVAVHRVSKGQMEIGSVPDEVAQLNVSTIVERPLFSPTRRVVVPRPVVARTAAPKIEQDTIQATVRTRPPQRPAPIPPPEFLLHGVMQAEGVWHALLSVDGAEPVWMEKKQLLNEWILSDINAEAVILEQSGKRIGVPLHP